MRFPIRLLYVVTIVLCGTVAVCEIFNVKEWRDFNNQVRGRSRNFYLPPVFSVFWNPVGILGKCLMLIKLE